MRRSPEKVIHVSDREVLEAVLDARRQGQNAALAVIIRDQGSVPRRAGTKMLIYSDGRIVGTIGGGEMENRVIAAVPDLIKNNRTDVIHYDLADPASGDPGVCGGQVDIYLEPILPDPTVLVIGCGHVGQAVADLAHWLGFRVVVSDDREALCSPEAVPHADEYIIAEAEKIASAVTIHSRTYIAAVTRGVPFDVALVPDLLASPAPYIGVIGSRRRWATAVKEMKENGVPESDLRRIHAPIGLELNAETPREIAVSIMAEIVSKIRGGTGETMKWLGTPDEAADPPSDTQTN